MPGQSFSIKKVKILDKYARIDLAQEENTKKLQPEKKVKNEKS